MKQGKIDEIGKKEDIMNKVLDSSKVCYKRKELDNE